MIDEIGSEEEVAAACSIGFRGIKLVATAHGLNLQERQGVLELWPNSARKEAMGNRALQALFGGVEKSHSHMNCGLGLCNFMVHCLYMAC